MPDPNAELTRVTQSAEMKDELSNSMTNTRHQKQKSTLSNIISISEVLSPIKAVLIRVDQGFAFCMYLHTRGPGHGLVLGGGSLGEARTRSPRLPAGQLPWKTCEGRGVLLQLEPYAGSVTASQSPGSERSAWGLVFDHLNTLLSHYFCI